MSSDLTTKARFRPTLLERLADAAPRLVSDGHAIRLVTADELKESVARDLESLLNCRRAHDEDTWRCFPEVSKSIDSYGMGDFVGLSLANPADRNHICRSLERTIGIHERRLTQVRVSLDNDNVAVNRLHFAIHALLVLRPSPEPVFFDALLQPSTLQYSVSKARRISLP